MHFRDRWWTFVIGDLLPSVVFHDRWWSFANGGLFRLVFFLDRWSFAIGDGVLQTVDFLDRCSFLIGGLSRLVMVFRKRWLCLIGGLSRLVFFSNLWPVNCPIGEGLLLSPKVVVTCYRVSFLLFFLILSIILYVYTCSFLLRVGLCGLLFKEECRCHVCVRMQTRKFHKLIFRMFAEITLTYVSLNFA